MGLSFGLGNGVTASIARFIGAEDKVNADNSAEHALVFAFIISASLTIFGLLYGKQILILWDVLRKSYQWLGIILG